MPTRFAQDMSPAVSSPSDSKLRKGRDLIIVDRGRGTEDLSERFARLAESCYQFSREINSEGSVPFPVGLKTSVLENLEIIRSVFAKWSVEILILIYLHGSMNFQGLKSSLESISSHILSLKLRRLEDLDLV